MYDDRNYFFFVALGASFTFEGLTDFARSALRSSRSLLPWA